MTPEDKRELRKGFLIMWGINLGHLLLGLVGFKIPHLGFFLMLILGYPVIALVYGIVILATFSDRDPMLKRGLLIALSVTILLSCGCWIYALRTLKF